MERRIYVLSSDMVASINAYKEEKGLKYETEAVRQLLDIALKTMHTPEDIRDDVLSCMENEAPTLAFAKVVLGHPNASSFSVKDDFLCFGTKSHGYGYAISSDGEFEKWGGK